MNIIFGSIYLALSLFMCIRGIKRGGRQSRLSFYFALWWAMVGISYFILNHYKQKNQPTNKNKPMFELRLTTDVIVMVASLIICILGTVATIQEFKIDKRLPWQGLIILLISYSLFISTTVLFIHSIKSYEHIKISSRYNGIDTISIDSMGSTN